MSESSQEQETVKTGRKPDISVGELQAQVETLTAVVAQMAHMTGNQGIILSHKLKPFVPTKKHMSKYNKG